MQFVRCYSSSFNRLLLPVVLLMFLAGAPLVLADPPASSANLTQSSPAPGVGPGVTRVSPPSDSADAAVSAFLRQLTASLSAKPDSNRDYFRKKIIDLVTTPSLWIFAIVAILLVVFREQVSGLIENLQSVKIGSVELVRAIGELATQLHSLDLNPDQEAVDADRLSNLAQFQSYPAFRIRETLDSPFIKMNWQATAARLRNLEMQLVLQEEHLLNSPDFQKENPPRNFVSARSQLFTMFVCFGNLYGFAKSPAPTEHRPVDLETSTYFLQKAIALKPEVGAQAINTIGYANFCMGAVEGLLGLELLGGAADLKEDAWSLMTGALAKLAHAEANGHRPPYQDHLKAYLLFQLGRFAEAAESWKSAATVWMPRSSKMYFNYACALSRLGKYGECLNQLERAVEIWQAQAAAGPVEFDPRKDAKDPTEGGEFKPFWGEPPVQSAEEARSDSGKSFAQITA
jgi:tetratricopeptide (TPR) repeat protein